MKIIVDNNTSLNLVVGAPLEHSQSPSLHNALYNFLKINTVLLPAKSSEIEPIVQVIKTINIALTALTMPLKEKILPYLDACSTEAEALQAVNTVINKDNKLYGYNTDVYGISCALRNVVIKNSRILILGAGGAARAAAFFLQKHAELFWLNRTPERAQALAKIFGGEVIEYSQLNNIPFDIIINTTPLGAFPNIQFSPLPNYRFNRQQSVFDMVYNPVETRLLYQAKKDGAKIISGIEMFVGQGLHQVELWTGKMIFNEDIFSDLKIKLISLQKNFLA